MDRLQRLADSINSVFSMHFERYSSKLYISVCPFDQDASTNKHLVKLSVDDDNEFNVSCDFCGDSPFYIHMNKHLVVFDALEYEYHYCFTSMDQLNIDHLNDVVIIIAPTGSNKASIALRAIQSDKNNSRFVVMVRCAYDIWQYKNLFKQNKINYSCYVAHQPFNPEHRSIIMEYKTAARKGHTNQYDRNIHRHDNSTIFDNACIFIDEFDEILQKKHDIPLNTLYHYNEVVSIETQGMNKSAWNKVLYNDKVLVSRINDQMFFNNYLHSSYQIRPHVLLKQKRTVTTKSLKVYLLEEDTNLKTNLDECIEAQRWFYDIQKNSFMPYIVEFLPADYSSSYIGESEHRFHRRYVAYDIYTIRTILERAKKLVLYSATVTKEILKLIKYVADLTNKKITIINVDVKSNKPKVVNITHTKGEIISHNSSSNAAIKALRGLNKCILIFKRTNSIAKKVCQRYQMYNLQLYTDDVYNGFSELKTPYMSRIKLRHSSSIVVTSANAYITRGRTIDGVFVTIIDTRISIPLYLNIGSSPNATYRNQIEKQINTIVQIIGRDKQQYKQIILLENYDSENNKYLLQHIVHRITLKGTNNIKVTDLDKINKKVVDYIIDL